MAAEGSAAETLALNRELGLTDLVFFNVIAVLGVQLISVFAHVGPVAIPLHVAAAALFFVPFAQIIASLSRRFPGEGGFYLWTGHAFGDRQAFLCGWTWWISNLLYLPGLVLMGVAMGTEAAGPKAAAVSQSVAWQVSFALCVLWLCVGVNILGLRVSKWLSNLGGSLLFVGGLLVASASFVIWFRRGSATRFNYDFAFSPERIGLWAQVAFAYAGLELGSLMGGEVRNPRKTIPRAVWISAAAVAGAYIAGSSLLMVVLSPDKINPMSGLVQVASIAGHAIGWPFLGTVTGSLLFLGILGKVSTWTGGSARLPFMVGIDGVFPAAFTRLHPRFRTPWVALVVQGVACSVFLLGAQSGETLRNGWQSLMDLTILVSFIPYGYIFLCGWKYGHRTAAAAGLFVTAVAMLFSMVPPEGSTSLLFFESKVIGGCIAMIFCGWLAYRYSRGGSNRRGLFKPRLA